MTLTGLLKTSGLSALAAALAFTALPAEALAADSADQRRGGWGEQRSDNRQQTRNSNRQQTQNVNRGNRQQARDWNRGDRQQAGAQRNTDPGTAWRRMGDRTRQVQQDRGERNARPATETQRNWAQNRERIANQQRADRGDRNRSYSDRDRNRSYRDGRRDQRQVERNRDYREDRRAERWNDRNRDRSYRDGYRDGRRSDYRDQRSYRDQRGYRSWDRRWRSNNRYNWYNYRQANRHHYRLGRYYSPYRNYHYSRLSIGFYLDSLFYSSRYWISDPWDYRLPSVYGPYRWVRYYDDVLLVNTYTGEVVDVIYDFFW